MAAWACASCGGENPEGMRFCGHCGTPAVSDPPVPPAAVEDHGVVSESDDAAVLRSFVTSQVADRLIEAGGHLTEQRRLVTALFADLSGFTPLSERLDPEELLEVIDPIVTALTNIVGRYEGFVEKFAGDALLALFGAPIAHEDDAARSLSVALEMHAELARLRTTLGPDAADLTLHIGVNSGHGVARMIGSQVRMDYGVLGDSVILAQRLESAAPPGETYVGESTYRLARRNFELEPLEPLTLKGKAEPVPAYRLIRRREPPPGQPDAGHLIGREADLAQGVTFLERIAQSDGRALAVVGEPGVGKSSLTGALHQLADARQMRWLEGRALAHGRTLAYWPLADLVRRAAGIRIEDPSALAARRLWALLDDAPDASSQLPYLSRLIGVDSEATPELDELEPDAFRRGLHEAFIGWLRQVAERAPTVVAIEDAQWADAPSFELLTELASAVEGQQLGLYLTLRGDPSTAVTALELPEQIERIGLSALNAADLGHLVGEVLGGNPPPGLVTAVIERSAGNPFFAVELVRALQDTDVLSRTDAGVWRLRPDWNADDVPASIEGVLSARIDALPSRAQTTLGVASVIGRRIPMAILREVASDPGGLEAATDQLIEAGLLDPLPGGAAAVRFHHSLVQDVAYSRLLRRRRRELHLRAAEAAERLYGTGDDAIELLARHLYLGQAGTKAVDYLVRAGERAKRLYANDEAIVDFQRAAEVARAGTGESGAEPLTSILLALADLQELRGRYDDALAGYREALDIGAGIRAWEGIAAIQRKQGTYRDALDTIDAAFASVDTDDRRALWVERAWTLNVSGHASEAAAAAEAGLISAPETHDAIAAQLLVQRASAARVGGRSGDALVDGVAAQAIFEELGDLRGLTAAVRLIGLAAAEDGDLDLAARSLARGIELAERTGNVEELGGNLINLGIVEQQRGDLDAAIACDRRAAEEFERIGHAAGRVVASANVAYKLATAGRLDEAMACLEQALPVARSIELRPAIAEINDTIALVRRQQGRYLEAAAAAEEAAQLYEQDGAQQRAREEFGVAAEMWAQTGDADRAARLRQRAEAAS